MSDTDETLRRTVDLLWRDEEPRRPGPGRRTSVADVVRHAIDVADVDGLASVTMRALADRVGLRTMSLYTYVPNRDVLIALMVDAVAADAEIPAIDPAACMRAIADQYRDEWLAHPWLADIPSWRPIPGPRSSRRYERQLVALTSALTATGRALDDIALDATVAALRDLARGNARARLDQAAEHARSGLTDAQWWDVVGPRLTEAMPADDYPVSGRIGSVVGQEFSGPGNADHAYRFGIDALVAGLLESW